MSEQAPSSPTYKIMDAAQFDADLHRISDALRSTLAAGEALPVRVTAWMWVEAKGRTPDAALVGLHREVDRWHTEEGWSLDDGKVSVSRWEDGYLAEAVLTRKVTW